MNRSLQSSHAAQTTAGQMTDVFSRSMIRRDQTVAIVGIGFLGALLTQLASTDRALSRASRYTVDRMTLGYLRLYQRLVPCSQDPPRKVPAAAPIVLT